MDSTPFRSRRPYHGHYGCRSPLVRFQTYQVLEIVGIGKDTLRTWKEYLPPIKDIDGRIGRYSLGQLLALFVIARASHDIGVPISRFATHADLVFESMEQQALPNASPIVLVVAKHTMFFVDESTVSFDEPAAAFVSVRWAKLAINDALNAVAPPPPETQLELQFDAAKIVGIPRLKLATNR
jgi:DNA-binding transcriptional MerR regulator